MQYQQHVHAAHCTCYLDIFHLRDDHLGPDSHPLPIEAIKVQRVRKSKGLKTHSGNIEQHIYGWQSVILIIYSLGTGLKLGAL